MERGAACEVLDVFAAVQAELLEYVSVRILYDVEVAVVAVPRNIVSVLAVPARVFYTNVFGRNHFAVEQHVFRAVFLVIVFYRAKYALHEVKVLFVVRDSEP